MNHPTKTHRIPDRLKDSFPKTAQFNSVAEKYKYFYFKIIDSTVNQIEERFDDDTLDLIFSISKIFKDKNEYKNLKIWDSITI